MVAELRVVVCRRRATWFSMRYRADCFAVPPTDAARHILHLPPRRYVVRAITLASSHHLSPAIAPRRTHGVCIEGVATPFRSVTQRLLSIVTADDIRGRCFTRGVERRERASESRSRHRKFRQ